MGLYLKLTHTPENLSLRFSVNARAWGILQFIAQEEAESRVLFSVEWHLLYFAEWFLDFHLPKLERPFWIADIKDEESISQAVMRPKFYNERLTGQWINDYLAPINLRRAFSYFEPIPQILIARRSLENGNPDAGEISLAGFNNYHRRNHYQIAIAYEKAAWAYRFSVSQYRREALVAMRQFLEDWEKIAPTSEKAKAEDLLSRILEISE